MHSFTRQRGGYVKRYVKLLLVPSSVATIITVYVYTSVTVENDILPLLWQYDGFEVGFCSPCDIKNRSWMIPPRSKYNTFLKTDLVLGITSTADRTVCTEGRQTDSRGMFL